VLCVGCCDVVAAVIWVLLIFWTFLGLAILCEEYFVPALRIICHRLRLPDDVAGASFMAVRFAWLCFVYCCFAWCCMCVCRTVLLFMV